MNYKKFSFRVFRPVKEMKVKLTVVISNELYLVPFAQLGIF